MRDYESYTPKELIEAYKSIDKEKYPEKTKIIEDQIYKKCNINQRTKLNSPEIQQYFDTILVGKEVSSFKEPYNIKTSNLINRISWIILLVTIIPALLYKEKILNNYIEYFFLGMSLFFLTQAIRSIYTRTIISKGSLIKEKERPILFRLIQALYYIMSFILFISAIKAIISS